MKQFQATSLRKFKRNIKHQIHTDISSIGDLYGNYPEIDRIKSKILLIPGGILDQKSINYDNLIGLNECLSKITDFVDWILSSRTIKKVIIVKKYNSDDHLIKKILTNYKFTMSDVYFELDVARLLDKIKSSGIDFHFLNSNDSIECSINGKLYNIIGYHGGKSFYTPSITDKALAKARNEKYGNNQILLSSIVPEMTSSSRAGYGYLNCIPGSYNIGFNIYNSSRDLTKFIMLYNNCILFYGGGNINEQYKALSIRYNPKSHEMEGTLQNMPDLYNTPNKINKKGIIEYGYKPRFKAFNTIYCDHATGDPLAKSRIININLNN